MPMAPGSTRLAWALIVVFGLQFATGPLLRPLVHPYAYSDFVTFYDAARCFATGQDPYDRARLEAVRDPEYAGWVGHYFYPPPFAAVAVRPLAALPFETSRRLWVVCEAAAYVIALALFAGLALPWPRPWRWAAAAALGAGFAPVALDLKLGSVSGVLLLLLAGFERARARGHTRRAALALAAAVLLKLTPALLLGFLLVRGERRLVAWTLLGGAAIVAACLPWTGVHAYAVYVGDVLPYLATASFAWFTNQSLDAFTWRLLVPNPDTTPWIASPMLQHVLSAAGAIAVLVPLAHSRPTTRNEPRTPALGSRPGARRRFADRARQLGNDAGAGAAVLPAVAPAARSRHGVARTALVVAGAYAACALPFPYTEAPLRSGIGLLLEAPRTYGLVAIYVATLGWRFRAGAVSGLPPRSGSEILATPPPSLDDQNALLRGVAGSARHDQVNTGSHRQAGIVASIPDQMVPARGERRLHSCRTRLPVTASIVTAAGAATARSKSNPVVGLHGLGTGRPSAVRAGVAAIHGPQTRSPSGVAAAQQHGMRARLGIPRRASRGRQRLHRNAGREPVVAALPFVRRVARAVPRRAARGSKLRSGPPLRCAATTAARSGCHPPAKRDPTPARRRSE
jgi:hypothetical protein